MRKAIALAAILAAGCTTMAAEEPNSGEIKGSCRAEGLESFVGQPATAEIGSEILSKSGAKKLRWIPHGAAVTMDYSPDRVNVELDPQNRIEGITCG